MKRLAALCVLIWAGVAFGQTQNSPVVQCSPRKATSTAQLTFSRGTELGAFPSPDRTMMAFEYFHPEHPNTPQIWVMDLAQGFKSARPLVDDDSYNSWPSWSPDSQWISFMSGKETIKGYILKNKISVLTEQIYKVNVHDGTIVQLTHFSKETALGDSTSWSVDGRIAFEYDDDIYSVSASGRNENKLIDLKAVLASGSLWGIDWSPDGSRLTFRGSPRGSSSGQQRIWVVDALGRHIVPVTTGPTDENPSWLDNEHILFERWSKRGEVRVCVVCLPASKVTCLTRGHVDIGPRADASGHTIFFARGDIPKNGTNTLFPNTHIYALTLAGGTLESK